MKPVFQPQDLGILLSYRCQNECGHCLYNCGPGWQEWMEPDDLQHCLQTVSKWEHAFQVHFTGGEPFLNFPLLLQAVTRAANLGISSYVETNAGWCLDERTVLDRFRQLKAAGMEAILVSCSPFHAERIPLERTLRAVSTAVEVFGMQRVWVYQPEWMDPIRQFGMYAAIPLTRWSERYGSGFPGMLWQRYGLIGGGRAGERLGYFTQRQPPQAFKLDRCRYEILHAPHSHLDLYGQMIPGFCSGITIGDWHEFDASMARLQGAQYVQFVALLVEQGPYGLFELARDAFGFQSLPAGYADKCHLCVDVRRHLVESGQSKGLGPLPFYHMFKPV